MTLGCIPPGQPKLALCLITLFFLDMSSGACMAALWVVSRSLAMITTKVGLKACDAQLVALSSVFGSVPVTRHIHFALERPQLPSAATSTNNPLAV